MSMEILKRRYKKLLSEVKTDIHRFLYHEIDWNQPLIGIKGQRGVGKTTLMLQRIKETDPTGRASFYASLDNLWFSEHSLIELAELFQVPLDLLVGRVTSKEDFWYRIVPLIGLGDLAGAVLNRKRATNRRKKNAATSGDGAKSGS